MFINVLVFNGISHFVSFILSFGSLKYNNIQVYGYWITLILYVNQYLLVYMFHLPYDEMIFLSSIPSFGSLKYNDILIL